MEEDTSHPNIMSGKHRYDNLIKTMIARIEYNNTLAPVQEYGRHQTKALKKKNKNKGAEDDPVKSKKDFDDRFYDLDDQFIDDGDMEDGYGMPPGGFEQDFYGDLDAEMTSTAQINVEYDPQDTTREEKKYAQLVKRFRVILPAEIDKML